MREAREINFLVKDCEQIYICAAVQFSFKPKVSSIF